MVFFCSLNKGFDVGGDDGKGSNRRYKENEKSKVLTVTGGDLPMLDYTVESLVSTVPSVFGYGDIFSVKFSAVSGSTETALNGQEKVYLWGKAVYDGGKEVIVDEINSYKDSPSDRIFDDFEELIYTGYPIGRNILGDEASVERISRDMVLDFVKRNYFPNRMVISSVGDIPFEKLVRLVEKYFSPYEVGSPLRTRIKPEIYTPRFVEMDKDTHQSHCIIGNVAYDYTEDNRLALSLLMNLLGGTGMNSRLNLNIREKYGLAYNIEASYTPYSDTGVSMIYFGCDPENAEWCLNLCKKEMRALYEEKLGPLQLKRAKAQMVGQLAISSENYENLMLSIGKSFLIYDKVDSLEDIYTQIEEITPELLIRVAKEIFDVDKQSVLLYK